MGTTRTMTAKMKRILMLSFLAALLFQTVCAAGDPEETESEAAAEKLSYFFLTRSGDIAYDSYEIELSEDEYRVSVNGEEEQEFPGEAADGLLEIVEEYDLESWDGFDESAPFVLDGELFRLEIRFADGTGITACGDNRFPPQYYDAIGSLQELLDKAVKNTGELQPLSEEGEEENMKLFIDDREVPVTWEDNESVAALRKLLPLTISMSMYGGFEQVGPIGQSIARNDKQTVTESGDIVLYSGDQIVVFYGSNSWAYTRLGHIDLSGKEMTDLLGRKDVEISIE